MYTKTAMKRVHGPKDVPLRPHFCVLIYNTQSVYIPGDQRSRDCPGHGYPEHRETYTSFEQWITEDAGWESERVLQAFILEIEEENKRSSSKSPYVVLSVVGVAQVKTEVKVTF